MNYTEVLNNLENIANESIFIKSFSSGSIPDLNDLFINGKKEFPKMWVTPEPFTITQGSIIYNVSVDILDICTDASNGSLYAEKVISDCTAIMNDIVTRLTNNLNQNNIYIELPVTVTPYFEKPSEYVAGVTATFSIIVDRNNAICNF